jgi:FKBP-type peptidyl-prolyl cis-trans isomerase FkpA
MSRVILFSLTIFLFIACKKEDVEKENREEIEKYISDNNLHASSTGSGLYYVIDVEGTGTRPNVNSDVNVKYKGYFTSNEVFDENSEGIEFNLQNVIAGWTEGIPLFKEGGNGMLLIPSSLAYGPSGRGSIPPNAVLIFDIELIYVVQ